MTWLMVGVGAVAVGTGIQSASASNAAVTAGARNSIQQNKQIEANNLASIDANLKNSIRTGYRVGILNVQQSQAEMEAVQKGYDISAAKQSALGAVSANQAAAGAIGASARAVLTDVRMKAGEAQAEALEDWKIQQFNFNTQLADLIFQGQSNLAGSQAATEFSAPSDSQILTSALIAGGMAGLTTYAGAKMKLGAGGSGAGGVGGSSGGTN